MGRTGVRTNARGRAARTAEIPQGDGASDVHSAGRKRISGIIIAIAIVALLIGGGYFGVTKLIAWRDSRSNQSTAIADYPGPGYG